jgi:aminoglycoside 6'-N-acetyltransferase I
MIDIRSVSREERGSWLRMRAALWPEENPEWHAEEVDRYLAGQLSMPLEVLLALDGERRVLGFVELSIRPYAEGCSSDRVAYLEGWYVDPDARRRGVGRELVKAAERWALSEGCREFGSDALLENEESAGAHLALGFEEVAQIRCFRKELGEHL